MKQTCPASAEWESLLNDRLSTEQELLLDDHLQICMDCQKQLEALTDPATFSGSLGQISSLSRTAQLPGNVHQELVHSVMSEINSQHEADQPVPEIPGYELQEAIGEGASSMVYRARDLLLDRTVAIKLLRNSATAIQRQRFKQEGKALATLHHLNVARIIEVGDTAGHAYLVLEYIAGGSLARHLAGQAQPVHAAARLIQQVAVGIQHAHHAGIIHRDLKPGNILLEPHFGSAETTGLDRFIPKIIDFGIAKAIETNEDLTQTRDFLGTPSYMAPEQISNYRKTVDQCTDVYALGIILYEMLTGRPPFRAASPIDTMLQIKHEEPLLPSRFEPQLPRDLENICLKCIEKEPSKRYASAQHLASDLQHFLDGKAVQARPISRIARGWRWSKRNPGWALAALLLFVMLLAAATLGPLMAHRERVLREEAASHAEQAAIERNRAHEHLNLAGRALEEMLDRLLNNLRLQDSAFDDIQRSLVTFAIPYLEQFVKQDDSTEALRLRQARSMLQLAMVQVKNREIDQAQATYERSLQLLESFPASTVGLGESLLRARSSAHLEYGRFFAIYRHDNETAERHYRLSMGYIDQLDQGTNNPKWFDTYAIHYSLLSSALTKKPQRAEESFQYLTKALWYRAKLMEQHPERDDLRHYAALTHMNMAVFYREQKQRAEEMESLRRALELEKQVNQSKSIWIESPFFVSTLEGELAMTLIVMHQLEEAKPHLRQAARISDALATVYPAVEKYVALNNQWKKLLARYDK